MAAPTISDFKEAFETAVACEDDGALDKVLTKMAKQYSKKKTNELYNGLVAACTVLFPDSGITFSKSNDIWEKHASLLGQMVERIDDISLATPKMEYCKEFIEEHAGSMDRLVEAMFDIMAEQKREVARDVTYVPPKAIYH